MNLNTHIRLYTCTHTHPRTHPQNTLHIKRIMGTQLYNSDGRFTNKVTTNCNSKIWYSQVYRYKYSVHIFLIFVPHHLFKARVIVGLQGNEPQQTKGPWADVGRSWPVHGCAQANVGPRTFCILGRNINMEWTHQYKTQSTDCNIFDLPHEDLQKMCLRYTLWFNCNTMRSHTHRKSLGTLPD